MQARSDEREPSAELHGKRRDARTAWGEVGTIPRLANTHDDECRHRDGQHGERKRPAIDGQIVAPALAAR
jgi:hypothetical protein